MDVKFLKDYPQRRGRMTFTYPKGWAGDVALNEAEAEQLAKAGVLEIMVPPAPPTELTDDQKKVLALAADEILRQQAEAAAAEEARQQAADQAAAPAAEDELAGLTRADLLKLAKDAKLKLAKDISDADLAAAIRAALRPAG